VCVLTIKRDGPKAGLLDELHRIFLDDDIISKLKSKSKKKKNKLGLPIAGNTIHHTRSKVLIPCDQTAKLFFKCITLTAFELQE
jgi:hypothetical protein